MQRWNFSNHKYFQNYRKPYEPRFSTSSPETKYASTSSSLNGKSSQRENWKRRLANLNTDVETLNWIFIPHYFNNQ